MWKNLKQKIYHTQVLAPDSAFAASGTTEIVNTVDLNSLAFLLNVGSFTFTGTNKITCTLEESEDDITWTPVTEVYEGTAPSPLVLDTVGESSKTHLVEYRGGKKWARLSLVVGGTVSVAMAVVAISNKPELMPPQ